MRGTARTGRSISVAAGLFLHLRNEFGNGAGRKILADGHDERTRGHDRDRFEIACRKIDLRGQWRKRQQCYGREETAYSRPPSRALGGPDDAGSAGFILNDEGLLERSLKMFGGQASQNVGNAAGRV